MYLQYRLKTKFFKRKSLKLSPTLALFLIFTIIKMAFIMINGTFLMINEVFLMINEAFLMINGAFLMINDFE
jgi:hypothetical protein